jgi:hypothetical protein
LNDPGIREGLQLPLNRPHATSSHACDLPQVKALIRMRVQE